MIRKEVQVLGFTLDDHIEGRDAANDKEINRKNPQGTPDIEILE